MACLSNNNTTTNKDNSTNNIENGLKINRLK